MAQQFMCKDVNVFTILSTTNRLVLENHYFKLVLYGGVKSTFQFDSCSVWKIIN